MSRTSFAAEMAKLTRDLAKAAPTPTTKAAPAGTIGSDRFLVKATYAATQGRITSIELTELERDVARKRQPRADLVKAVVAGGGSAERSTVSGLGVAEFENVLSGEAFMAKAMDMQKEGKLTGRDIAEIELSFNRGVRPAPHLARAVETGRAPELW